MTDLTILIAVIALALWPIVFLISRILHERNKRAKPSGDTASAETEEVTEEMTTSALIMSILQQLGCQPEVNEENHISFQVSGRRFPCRSRRRSPVNHCMESLVGVHQYRQSGITLSERDYQCGQYELISDYCLCAGRG